jgi:hypothetical protein
MVNSDTSAQTHAKDSNRTVTRLRVIPRLTDEDIRVAFSYREENPDNREYCAKVGVIVLRIVIVIAFATLFFHAAIR